MIKTNKDFWTFHAVYWVLAGLALFAYGLTYGHAQVALVRNIYNPLIGFACSYLIRAIYDHWLPAGFEKRLLVILLCSMLGGLVSSLVVNPVTYGLLGYDLQSLSLGNILKDGLYFVLFYLVWSLLYLQFMGESLVATPIAVANLEFISVTKNNKKFKLDPANLAYIKASGDYVELFTEQDSYLKQGTIGFYEQALSSGSFARIHRSVIINPRKIVSVSGPNKGQYWITLQGGHEVRSSRKYQDVAESLTPTAP